MANLKKEDLLKEIPGDKSKKRFTIINDKIKNKSPFTLANGKTVVLQHIDKKMFSSPTEVKKLKGSVLSDKKGKEYKLSDLVKTPEFGGGGGSGAGAAVTKLGESAQCLYAGLSFYVKKKKISAADANIKNLTEATKYIDCLLYTSPSPRDRG